MNTIEKFPISITPNFLVDAVVDVRFDTLYNQTELNRKVCEYLDKFENDKFLEYKPTRREKDLQNSENSLIRDTIYSNSKFKLVVNPLSISFNISDEYPGWKAYEEFIFPLCNHISQLVRFKQIAMRCIDHLTEESIFENVDGEIKLTRFPHLFNDSTLKFICKGEKNGHNHKITTILVEKTKVGEDVRASIVDITVESDEIPDNIPDNAKMDIFKEYLSRCHIVQKDVFFKIMSDDFIGRHNPVY